MNKSYWILLVILLGCEIKINNERDTDIPEVLINYNEEKNEIFTSVSLEHFKNMDVDSLEIEFEREGSFLDLTVCIENDSIYDFSSTTTLEESNCLYFDYQNYGCINKEAINYDIFANFDNGNCKFEGDWRQFKLGRFDIETYSFPIYLISSKSFQWFEFDIKGLQVEAIESLNENIPCDLDDNNILFNNFNLIQPGTYEIVRVYLSPPPNNYVISLNDLAINGDMIANNQIFHSKFTPESFIPGNYLINFDYLKNDGDETRFSENYYLDYNFTPRIINVEMPSEVMLNDSLWTTLEFYVTVFDANNNINQVKYLINTSDLTNDYESVESDDFFSSDPSWIMEYNNFVEKNTFRYTTIIPLKPAVSENPQDEGRTGEAIFQFNVFDLENQRNTYNNISQFQTSILLLKCGDEICSENYEDENSCPKDCFE
ncbi:MAG: hypothetical protein CMF96_01010 [Candidatus Marinimicrobia bacterium]|nr:hypothetical protein [Candidatus Neomarinimicrobiota bacterium]|tara:strand:+ start:413 stop:1702 length:1290 start_codon:yes stop_codon:yes gene_type:complete